MKKFIVFLPIIALLIVSCSKKRDQKKIIGSWEYQYFQHHEDNRAITWVFADDQTLTQYHIEDTNADTIVATYAIEKKFGDAHYVIIKGIDTDNDGKYQILKLNKKYLIMERVEQNGHTQGVFVRKEFIKKQ